jgi:hypothetical protein
MCVILVDARLLKSSPLRCAMPPVPDEAKFSLPGFFLSY